MSPTDQIGFGLRAFSYVAVKHVPLLETILKRISGGRINRHSLAQAAWRSAVEIGSKYAVNEKWLGDRSATVVPLLVQAFASNDPEKMRAAIRALTSDTLDLCMHRDAPGLSGLVAGPLHDVAGTLAENLSAALLGNHAMEKTLATMTRKYGFEPIEQYLRDNLGEFFGREFAIVQTMNCIEDLVDDPAYIQTGNDEYEALADLLYRKLRGQPDENYLDLLKGYAPEAFYALRALGEMGQDMVRLGHSAIALGKATIAGRGPLIDGGRHVVTHTIPAALDNVQRMLGGGVPRPLELAYGNRAAAALADLPATASDSDIANTMLHEFVELASSEELCIEPNPSDVTHAHIDHQIASLAATRTPEVAARLQCVADALSPAQLMPLGPRGETRVNKTWAGRVTEIHGTNHHWLTADAAVDAQTERALRAASNEATRGADGDTLDEALAARLDTLDLTVGSGAPGESGAEVMAQLKQACGGDPALMKAALRYLDEAVAHRALAKPTEAQMHDKTPGMIDAGRAWVKLENIAAPRYTFHVHRVEGSARTSGFVKIDIEARWTISAYGPDASQLRAPRGTTGSFLAAGASVTLRPVPAAALGGVTVACCATGRCATITNFVAFDPHTGAMLAPGTPGQGRDAPRHDGADDLPRDKRAAPVSTETPRPSGKDRGTRTGDEAPSISTTSGLLPAAGPAVLDVRVSEPAITPRPRWGGMANASGQLEID